MHAKVIQAMKDKGWSLDLIANRSGISYNRLVNGNLGRREEALLYRCAEQEARIDIDLILEEDEE
jgi:hypothetical protein